MNDGVRASSIFSCSCCGPRASSAELLPVSGPLGASTPVLPPSLLRLLTVVWKSASTPEPSGKGLPRPGGISNTRLRQALAERMVAGGDGGRWAGHRRKASASPGQGEPGSSQKSQGTPFPDAGFHFPLFTRS